ncbi:HD domain-containing protein [Burkholderia alba]|uniref:HD domain-containing protein n=1 Tax=Burkholderia alba TaxID=2683677 RepID=UPI002B053054|nr:HD domain-containing protein [Burkholderia alba]
MNTEEIHKALAFLREAERLKDVLRSAHTSGGRRESTAEHTWRLCLMAMVFESEFADIDFAKLLKICVLHDLGEAIGGDVPATEQRPDQHKSARERADLETLTAPLAASARAHFMALWEEYEHGASPEARLVKGLDKLETILQHNQGRNPPDFDYAFNLAYGQRYMDAHPLFAAIRALLDHETRARADADRASPA